MQKYISFAKFICIILHSSTDSPPSFLEENVSKIRKSAQALTSEYQHYTGVISDTASIGFEHSRCK